MTALTTWPNIMSGQIFFTGRVSQKDVLALAVEFKEKDSRVKGLLVRERGKDEYGKKHAIAFEVEYDGTHQQYEKLVYKLTDQLKRRFGNDATWDISSWCWRIE